MSYILFTHAPPAGSHVIITYYDTNSGSSFILLKFTGDGRTNVFDFKTVIVDKKFVTIAVDGILLYPTDWSLSVNSTFKKLYIIAGDVLEFNEFVDKKTQEYPFTYFEYVHDAKMLMGLVDPDGICIGKWKDRTDILDILSILRISSRSPEKSIRAADLYEMAVQHRNKNVKLHASTVFVQPGTKSIIVSVGKGGSGGILPDPLFGSPNGA